ncbi:hypothetical protein SDC9_89892 [bioreactor metagenome]|uniref:Bacteriophage holin n=1 Tax=bioreactor metagenome TaxID=1076179 RepID=A0A644ZQG1_9ZZZZ
MKEYLKRLKNPGTILSVVSIVGLLLVQFGFKIDLVWLDTTGKLICSLGILIGIFNNPTTGGVDLPIVQKKETPEQFKNQLDNNLK